MTDGQLLECFVSRRDATAFAALVQRHAPMVWGICLRILRNHHDAEDAFQATFLVLARKAALVTPREMVAGWLFGVARQTALNASGHVARIRSREMQLVEIPDQTMPDQAGWHDVQPLLDEELSRLPDKYRAVIVLCELEGISRKAAARQLGVPEGTVAGWLARAKKLLASRLARQGFAFSGVTLAALMTRSVAAASESVLVSTNEAVGLYAASQTANPGVIIPDASSFSGKLMNLMLLPKFKIAAAVLLLAGLVGGAASRTSMSPDQNQESASEPANSVIREPASYAEAHAIAAETAGFKNLQRMGLAFHGYHDLFGQFPPAVLPGPDGKSLYSWRVELLPVLKHYVDGVEPEKLSEKISRATYHELIAACGYDVNQPWDSAHNRRVLDEIPNAYRHPEDQAESHDSAYYAVVGKGSAFDPNDTAKYTDIKDWPATTLMIVESRSREPWTRPVDISYSSAATVPRFGGFTKHGYLALSCDGAVHFVSDVVSADNLRAFISKDPADALAITGIPFRYESDAE